MNQTIVVKYQSGALGNFLCLLLINENPFLALDYGKSFLDKDAILHTGAYSTTDDFSFKKVLQKNIFKIISHNNIKFNPWIETQNFKSVFINLNSHFVEYRLNYIVKMPNWNKKLNDFAINESWKNFQYPVACDDARRIVRLSKGIEQQIPYQENKDIVYNFRNFYILNSNEWAKQILFLGEQLGLTLSKEKLLEWHKAFLQSQKEIIDRSLVIYNCISNNKFIEPLSENEKGIIIGYLAVRDNTDEPEYFIKTYERLSKN